MACFRMKSVTITSYDFIPGTVVPVIGISCCAGGGGESGDVGGSPAHARRTARHASGMGLIKAFARCMSTVTCLSSFTGAPLPWIVLTFPIMIPWSAGSASNDGLPHPHRHEEDRVPVLWA